MTSLETHTKNLARIDELHNEGNFGIPRATSTYYPKVEKIYKALRAVVELHRRFEVKSNHHPYPLIGCKPCSNGTFITYPCPTIQAIEKELG